MRMPSLPFSWRNCAPAVALAALACAPAAAAADPPDAPVRIELPANARVSRPDVRLGEIAALTTRDLPLLKRLMALPLGPAPRAGHPVPLTRAELMRWITAQTGIAEADVAWGGPGRTQVQRASSEIAGDDFVAAARATLEAWLAQRSTRAQVTVSAPPRDVAVPFGQGMLRVRPIAEDQPLSSRMLLWVDVWVDGNFVRGVPVSFEVQAFGPVLVAAQALPTGARADAASFALEEAELTGRAAARAVPAAALLARAQQLRQPMEAGQVLSAADLQAEAAVARGDWVTLLVRSGGIALESRAEALQGGRVGQLVSVRSAQGSAPVVARVVGRGQVEVTQ